MRSFSFVAFSLSFAISCLPSIGGAQLVPGVTVTRDDAVTLAAITQLLSLFSQSLDNKDFNALGNVFADNIVLDQGGGFMINGSLAVTQFYRTAFQNASIVTQHTSDTVFGSNFTTNSASSTSYANARYFGPAVVNRRGFLFPGQSAVYREKFINQYVKTEGKVWKIARIFGPRILVRCSVPSSETTVNLMSALVCRR